MASNDDLILQTDLGPCWTICPSSNEQHVMSIVSTSGGTNGMTPLLSWSLHYGSSQSLYPYVFWQTPPIRFPSSPSSIPPLSSCSSSPRIAATSTGSNNSNSLENEKVIALYQFLPIQVRNLLYGPKKSKPAQLASTCDSSQPLPSNQSAKTVSSHSSMQSSTSESKSDALQGAVGKVAVDDLQAEDNQDFQDHHENLQDHQESGKTSTRHIGSQRSKVGVQPSPSRRQKDNSRHSASPCDEADNLALQKKKEADEDDAKFYTSERAIAYRSAFRVPVISVYVVTTDDAQVQALARLFRRTVPCKIFPLKASDFVIPTVAVTLRTMTEEAKAKPRPSPPKRQPKLQKSRKTQQQQLKRTWDRHWHSNSDNNGNGSNHNNEGNNRFQAEITSDEFNNTHWIGINMDRLCLLQGAKYLFEPSQGIVGVGASGLGGTTNATTSKTRAYLILDSGNSFLSSYTATDRTGRLIGGGVGPSITTKLRAVSEYTARLTPLVSKSSLLKYVQDICSEQTKRNHNESQQVVNKIVPVSIEHAVVQAVLKEAVLSFANVILGWMDQVGIQYRDPPTVMYSPNGSTGTNSSASTSAAVAAGSTSVTIGSTSTIGSIEKKARQASAPVLILTGCDSAILEFLLLRHNHGSLKSFNEGISLFITRAVETFQLQVEVCRTPLLMHHGIQHALLQKQHIRKSIINTQELPALSAIETVRDVLIGQRVATLPPGNEKFISSIVTNTSKSSTEDLFYAIKVQTLQQQQKQHIMNSINTDDEDETISIADEDYNLIYGTVVHIWRYTEEHDTDDDHDNQDNQDDDQNYQNDNNKIKKKHKKLSTSTTTQHPAKPAFLDCYTNDSLEDYYFSIFWDDSYLVDDVTPTDLYNYLLLYAKSNESKSEPDEQRKSKLEKKSTDAKYAADLLALRSTTVRTLYLSRNAVMKDSSTSPSLSSTQTSNMLSAGTTTSETTDMYDSSLDETAGAPTNKTKKPKPLSVAEKPTSTNTNNSTSKKKKRYFEGESDSDTIDDFTPTPPVKKRGKYKTPKSAAAKSDTNSNISDGTKVNEKNLSKSTKKVTINETPIIAEDLVPPTAPSTKKKFQKKSKVDLSMSVGKSSKEHKSTPSKSKVIMKSTSKVDNAKKKKGDTTKKSKKNDGDGVKDDNDGDDNHISVDNADENDELKTDDNDNDETAGEEPYVRRRIAKDFGDAIYFGHVKRYIPASINAEGVDMWYIQYDDGDAEDLEEDELIHGFLLYRKHSAKDNNKNILGLPSNTSPSPSMNSVDKKRPRKKN